MKILVSKDQEQFLKSGNCSCIQNDKGEHDLYYYHPFYYREIKEGLPGEYEIIPFEKLPDNVKEHFEKLRNP
jgi:hypothetical protein